VCHANRRRERERERERETGDPVVGLATRHRGTLVRFAAKRLGAWADDAEDLVEEVILSVLEGRIVLPPAEGRVLPFILGVIRHRAKHVIRRHSRTLVLHREQDEPQPTAAWQQAHAALLGRDLRRAFSCLTRAQREILDLRFLEGLAVGSVAEVRRVKPQTVKELERRGLARLRRALQCHDPA
jgi:RNA polymerase sigma-70 factor (ECF subfamily)